MKCEGEFFVVEDVVRDVVWRARVKSAQHVKSMLGNTDTVLQY